jgi:hypothetical protein
MAPRAALRRRQGDDTKRLHTILTQHGHQFWETAFFHEVVHRQRLLRFPDQPPRRLINGQFKPRTDRAGLRTHQKPQAHDVPYGLVQHHVDVIKRDDIRETLGEIMKELAQVAM